jgi:putative spermidine/putrescine transport system permease protein
VTSGTKQQVSHLRAGRQRGRSLDWRSVALLMPAFLAFGLFLIVPLIVALWKSFEVSPVVRNLDHFGYIANYAYLLSRPHYISVFVRTFEIATTVVIVAFVLGYATALMLRKVYSRWRSTLVLGLTFHILAGPLAMVIGWLYLMTGSGPINQVLMSTGLIRAPLQILGSDTAIIIAMTQFTLPFVVLSLLDSLLKIDQSLTEVASSLGANPAQVFWHVIWPLSLPGVAAALIISFSLSVSAFVAPRYLGAGRLVVTTLIEQFLFTTFDMQMATTVGTLLVLISFVIMFAFSTILSIRIERQFGNSR